MSEQIQDKSDKDNKKGRESDHARNRDRDRYHTHEKDHESSRGRNRERDRERDRDRGHDRDRDRHHHDRDHDRDRDKDRERSRDKQEKSHDHVESIVATPAAAIIVPDTNAAVIAAMEAAKKLSKSATPASKPRVSRFSNTILTKKMYFPQQNVDIDYIAIFNSPFRVAIETETHTTLTVGGTATLVTEMDEPLHVVISAGGDDSMKEAEERVSDILNKPDLARRLAQQYSRMAEVTTTNPLMGAVSGLMNRPDLSDMVVEVMHVPVPMVPLIMGRGAEHVKKMQEVFSVDIRVQKDHEVHDNSMLRDVTIRGRQEQVNKTKEVISTMIQTGKPDIIRTIQSSRDGFERIAIPRDRVGMIVGTKGATIHELQKRTATSIQVAREDDPDHPDTRFIVITGDPENVIEAKRQVLLIADGQMVNMPAGAQQIKVQIPSDKVSYVIGTKGAVIQEIQRKSGATVQVEKSDKDRFSQLRTVTIYGTDEQQEAAKAEINRIIGTTAGIREYGEDEFASDKAPQYDAAATYMSGMFNSTMDLEQMQKYLEMQMMNPQFMYGMNGGAPAPGQEAGAPPAGGLAQSSFFGNLPFPAGAPPMPPPPGMQPPSTQPQSSSNDGTAVPGVDDDDCTPPPGCE